MIKAGIIGSTGYAGQELVRLLSGHRKAEIEFLSSQSYAGHSYSEVFPLFKGVVDMPLVPDNDSSSLAARCDVVFTALPHGEAAVRISDELLARTRIIDIGSDFRLKAPEDYAVWYEMTHEKPELLSRSVYGLSEWRRNEIREARLIANPGCYATSTLLSLLPLVKADVLSEEPVIVDAKSGVSGAGRSLSLGVHFNEATETVKAYKVAAHRHTPEIEQELLAAGRGKGKVVFTPHLIPMNRGILTTSYLRPAGKLTRSDLYEIYSKTYENEPFVRVLPSGFPETRWVKGSNYFDVGLAVDERTGLAIVIGALDNLMKGAAGQAVQNMNIMFGFDEGEGIGQVPIFP